MNERKNEEKKKRIEIKALVWMKRIHLLLTYRYTLLDTWDSPNRRRHESKRNETQIQSIR